MMFSMFSSRGDKSSKRVIFLSISSEPKSSILVLQFFSIRLAALDGWYASVASNSFLSFSESIMDDNPHRRASSEFVSCNNLDACSGVTLGMSSSSESFIIGPLVLLMLPLLPLLLLLLPGSFEAGAVRCACSLLTVFFFLRTYFGTRPNSWPSLSFLLGLRWGEIFCTIIQVALLRSGYCVLLLLCCYTNVSKTDGIVGRCRNTTGRGTTPPSITTTAFVLSFTVTPLLCFVHHPVSPRLRRKEQFFFLLWRAQMNPIFNRY
mmetsp:Transcript_2649/g.6204  ORF Transcript_2649/g.6204 Transcript_2649/m.6204 type:complete len:263 (-) Transcript_2649:28-816(-)